MHRLSPRVLSFLALVTLVLSITGWGGGAQIAAAPVSPAASLQVADTWDGIVAAAREEGVLVLSGPRGLDELQRVILDTFEPTFGIPVEYSRVGPDQIREQVLEERARGEYNWDIFIGGNDTLMFRVKPLGLLDPIEDALILPEVRDPSNWDGGTLPFWDDEGMGIAFLREAGQYFFVNTTMVDPNSVTTYRDFLDPRWRGKILLTGDPRSPGHGRSVFAFFYEHPDLGPDFVRALLTQQELVIPQTDDEVDELLLSGEFAMCICNRAQGAALRAAQLPYVNLDPHRVREGIDVTSSFANLALVSHAAHPNAARLFINWFLSPEINEMVSRATGVPSTRADVAKDFVPPGTVPDPSWLVANHEDNQPRAAEAARFVVSVIGPRD